MNLEEFDFEDSDVIDVQIIDYYTYFGAYIDRQLNRDLGVVHKTSSFMNKPNFKSFTPTNTDFPDIPNYLPMTMQVLVKIESKIKLNLIDHEGESMIQDSESKEIHFMLLESVTDRYELSWRVLKKIFNKFRKPKLAFEDWVLVDFDNCLKGNPIVDEE